MYSNKVNELIIKHDMDKFLMEHAEVTGGSIDMVLEEDAKPYAVDKTLDMIFESMLEKYSKIDFGDIPNTKGDITKWKHYENLAKCIASLTNIDKNSGPLPAASVLNTALNNIVSLEPVFKEGFMKKNPYVILQYNVMTYSLFHATSTVISSVIDFIQNGAKLEVGVIKYHGSDKIMIIDTLASFNSQLSDGTYSKTMREALEVEKIQHESITVAGLAAAWKLTPLAVKILLGIWGSSKVIPLSKILINLVYNARTRLSEAAQIQADYLELNMEALNNRINPDNEQQVKRTIEKQSKIMNAFKKAARFFAVKNDKAESETSQELRHEPKYNMDEFVI